MTRATRASAAGDRSTRISDPLAPGSGVELGAAQARDSRLSKLWQAVTPGAAHRRHVRAVPCRQDAPASGARSSAAGRKRPPAPRLAVNGWFTAPAMWPATASMGSTDAGNSARRRAHPPVDAAGRASSDATSALSTTAAASTPRGEAAAVRRRRPRFPRRTAVAPPAATQALSPPSSTADGRMSHPSQHPPRAGGEGSVVVIVGDDLGVIADPPSLSSVAAKCLRRRAADGGRCSSHRCRQILVQIRITRSGYVAAQVRPAAGLRVRQIEAAVDHRDAGVAHQFPQRGGIDQGREMPRIELSAMPCAKLSTATIASMALTLYWGSGSPFSWRVLLGARAQGAALRVAAAALRQAGAPIAADVENESARPGAGLEGRRLRGVRVGGHSLLPGSEIPAAADFWAQPPRRPASSCA